MNKTAETWLAWMALGSGILLALAGALWPAESKPAMFAWEHASFWFAAFGFSGFFGFGCFNVWQDPGPAERAARGRTWVCYQYALNGFGCFVGWAVLGVLLARLHESERIEPTDFTLAAVAFIGLVGWLPMALLGVATGLVELAKKAAGLAKG